MLSPQAARYTNGAPNQGYYYDALDYSVADLTLAGGNITVLPGTAIAVRNQLEASNTFATSEGFTVQEGSAFTSHGTPTRPIIYTVEKLVQEQSQTVSAALRFNTSLWFDAVTFVSDWEQNETGIGAPTFDFRFSKFYLPADDYHIAGGLDEAWFMPLSYDSSMFLNAQDCTFQGGDINLGDADWYDLGPDEIYAAGAVTIGNTAFKDVDINLEPSFLTPDTGVINCDMQVQATHNLFKGADWFHLEPEPATAGHWTFTDNLFDKVDIIEDTNGVVDYSNNGYWPLTASELVEHWEGEPPSPELQPATNGVDGAAEQILATAPAYQTGPFGDFYLPTNTVLYGAGSDTAANLGLYQYTTRFDQVTEGNDVSTAKPHASIGLHYIAAGGNGQPLDTDGDGVPDYVEDANGNGIVDANETDPNNPMTDGVTPDAYSTIYDNVDLDGDGLTGAAERFFGTSPLISDNPLSLQNLPRQSALSGLVQIPLNIGSNVDPSTTFTFDVNGIAQYTTIYQTNGNWFAVWDTTKFANGNYQLSLEYDLDENTPIFGATMFVRQCK